MLKLTAALVAALLVSPALAKNTTIKATPPRLLEKCVPLADFELLVPEGVTVAADLQGDALKPFLAFVAKRNIDFGGKVDEVRIYDRSTLHLPHVFATFSKGCTVGMGQIDDKAWAEFAGSGGTSGDGSI